MLFGQSVFQSVVDRLKHEKETEEEGAEPPPPAGHRIAGFGRALAAAGRGVAVASDDPRFGLLPLAIDINDTSLEVRLCAAWDPRGVAAASIEILGDRLAKWVAGQYEHSAVR